ncbi:hypothetical protein FRC02_000402, partial [Tulasnella sp. 418]
LLGDAVEVGSGEYPSGVVCLKVSDLRWVFILSLTASIELAESNLRKNKNFAELGRSSKSLPVRLTVKSSDTL